jgi:hypothetical protein
VEEWEKEMGAKLMTFGEMMECVEGEEMEGEPC